MFFKHVYDKSLAQGSYMIGCQATGETIVIDAKRDIDTYLEIAREEGLRITHLAETHIHADFLAGTRELAAVTGAKMYLSDEGGDDWQYEFAHEGLKDGDVIKVGNLSLRVIHTPGHTPESISFVLTDHPASEAPVMVFTGDFVFVGDVGRPDLLEKAAGIVGTQDPGARQLFRSLEKFSSLPPFVQVWPGHGAGSACGKALGSVPGSTVGYEVIRNWAFRFRDDEDGFVDYLLTGQPEPPKYFAMMKKLNKVDRPLLTAVPQLPYLAPEAFSRIFKEKPAILDTRPADEFAKAHIAGSFNVPGNLSFPTWAGWLVDYDTPIVLVARPEQTDDLVRKLMRIGLDRVAGYITDISAVAAPLQTSESIDIETFQALRKDPDVQVVDVRNALEFEAGHIEGANHIFVGTLADQLDQLDADKQVVVHCQSGTRAAIAQSVLHANGFRNVKRYTGGMKEWKEKGKPVSRLVTETAE